MVAANSKDINTCDQFGRTPLIFCVLADRVDCAEILLKAGCKVDQKDETGRTALHWAAHKVYWRGLQSIDIVHSASFSVYYLGMWYAYINQ